VHDLLHLASLQLASDAGTSSGIKVALITAVSVVLAAGLTALAATRAGRGENNTELVTANQAAWTNFNAELTRRAVTAEQLCGEKDKEIRRLDRQIVRLRDMCWQLGHDPDVDIEEASHDQPPA
jgi:hypothetical protein